MCGLIDLKWNVEGLIPVITQDAHTGQVLTLAYMNKESLEKTLSEGRVWFWSRSRKRLWMKGEESGNVQTVEDVYYDCDADALLVKVEPAGPACHTGEKTCFYRKVDQRGKGK